MKIYQAFKNNPYLLHLFMLFMMMGINAHHALAKVSHEITIACPGTKVPKAPQDLLRAKDDGQTWSFILAPAEGVTISDQKWTVNGEVIKNAKETNDPNWGTFVIGDNNNELDWLSDPRAGSFTIGVTAKRHCTGGGGGGGGRKIDDSFAITWGGTVITIVSIKSDHGAQKPT